MEPLRYVFFGTPRFARIVLEELLAANLTPLAIVTNSDKPQGRKHVITPPLTKQLIEDQGLRATVPIFQPERLADIRDELVVLAPDVFVIAAYSKILKPDTLELPPHGTIGVHPSLLPHYRGVAPIQAALLDGLKETGVTLFKVDEAVDHGPIIGMEQVVVEPADTYLTLEEKLARAGGKLTAKLLADYMAGNVSPVEQDHNAATFTKKFFTLDAYLDWDVLDRALRGDATEAPRIYNMMRALNPEPGVWTTRDGKRMKLLKSSLSPEGALLLHEVQWEGKKPGVFRQ